MDKWKTLVTWSRIKRAQPNIVNMNNEFYDTIILSQIAKQMRNPPPINDVIFDIDDSSQIPDDEE